MSIREKGFTAIEILIVIAIMGILVSIVGLSFSSFRNNNVVGVEVENLVSLISQARIDTLTSKDDSVYGIHVESGRAVLFKGSTFSEPDSDNIEVSFDSGVELADIDLHTGGSDIVFKRLTGETEGYGTMKLVLSSATTTNRVITVYSTGLVDID